MEIYLYLDMRVVIMNTKFKIGDKVIYCNKKCIIIAIITEDTINPLYVLAVPSVGWPLPFKYSSYRDLGYTGWNVRGDNELQLANPIWLLNKQKEER